MFTCEHNCISVGVRDEKKAPGDKAATQAEKTKQNRAFGRKTNPPSLLREGTIPGSRAAGEKKRL